MTGAPEVNTDDWVDQYGDTLFRYARARVGSREIAEDLVQETFLAALGARQGFKGQSSERTWLLGILKHKHVDHYRRDRTHVQVNGKGDKADPTEVFFNAKGGWQIRPAHWSANPGKAQETKEFLDHFYHCLTDLPQRTADAFLYREVEGLDTKEICRLLDITLNNCWVLLHRARLLLGRCLDAVGLGRHEEGVEK